MVVQSMGKEEMNFETPGLERGSDKRELMVLQRGDSSLSHCISLGDKGDKGFCWVNGVLCKKVLDEIRGEVVLVVVPQAKRKGLLVLAHDKSCHLGHKKVLALLSKKFYWPFMVRDVVRFCKSCEVCARCSKQGNRRAPLCTRPILTEPFQVIACDIVGPLRKGRNGYRYILTSICLASRWPTAIPLKNVRAGTVAQGMLETFSQTSIPLELLTDRGAQFTGKLFEDVAKLLSIDHLKTTAYHPQCNGAVERLNGTLKQALTKQESSGVDWVDALPIVLYHLRQAKHAFLGMSLTCWFMGGKDGHYLT